MRGAARYVSPNLLYAISEQRSSSYIFLVCGEKESEGGYGCCAVFYITDKNAHIIFGGVFKMPGRLVDWFWLCLGWFGVCSFLYISMPLHAGYIVYLKINTRRHFRCELLQTYSCIPHQSMMEKKHNSVYFTEWKPSYF